MYVCSANGEHVNSQEGVFSSTHTMYNIVIILQNKCYTLLTHEAIKHEQPLH